MLGFGLNFTGLAQPQNPILEQRPNPPKNKRKVQHSQPRICLKQPRRSHIRTTLLDFLTPVKTTAEKQLFWELLPFFKKGRTVDWKKMAVEWNRKLTDLIENGLLVPENGNHLFFKHYTDLEEFGKKMGNEIRDWEARHHFHALQALQKMVGGGAMMPMQQPVSGSSGLSPYLSTPRDEAPKRHVAMSCPSEAMPPVLSGSATEVIVRHGRNDCIIDLTGSDHPPEVNYQSRDQHCHHS
jgi:hypothetical protein